MKSRIAVCALAAVLLAAFVAPSLAGAYVPDTVFARITVTLNQRLATRTGPGTQYDEPGSFFSAGTRVTALSRAYDQRNGIWWIHVEFTANGERYRAYTGAKRFSDLNLYSLPEEQVLGYCYVPENIPAFYGPSEQYKRIRRDVPGGRDVDIIAVSSESGRDFYQVEFYDPNAGCTRRAWVRMNDVSRDYFYDNAYEGNGGGTYGGGTYGGGTSYPSVTPFPTASWSLSLRNPNVDRIRPQCGPGYNYSVFASVGSGGNRLYNPRNITYLSAHFCVGDWVYVEFGYTDRVLRYGFFEKSLFNCPSGWYSVPEYSLSDGRSGRVTRNTVPYNGPSTSCGDYSSCTLYSGTSVTACMEYGGWYLCRFNNNHGNNYGTVYLWVPGSSIAWN